MCSGWSYVVVTAVPPSDEKQTCIKEELMTDCALQNSYFSQSITVIILLPCIMGKNVERYSKMMCRCCKKGQLQGNTVTKLQHYTVN